MVFTEKGFEFTEKNGGASVTKVLTPGAVCVVPETLGGMPVVELADRAMAETAIKEVYLPRCLRRIGRYGFYNCEHLQSIHFFAETREIGGGVFNGCRNIQEIYICMEKDEKSALKDFVTEIADRVMVHYIFEDETGENREAARLIFPEYYDESIENTPARNLSFKIHGSGQKYRYCFGDRKLQFDRYDKMFTEEIEEESLEAASEVAVNRLRFPYGLAETAKKRYEDFLRKNLYKVLFVNMKKSEVFKWLIAEFADRKNSENSLKDADHDDSQTLSLEELDKLIAESSLHHLAEISGILLDLKRVLYPPKRKKFEF